MGKRKLEHITFIEDKIKRYVTFCKRKKGFIKKAIELSLLCGQHMALYIYDPSKQKLITYNSTGDFNAKTILTMTNERKYRGQKLL